MVQWHDNGTPGLTVDDVLIRPQYSELESRLDADPHVDLKLHNQSDRGCGLSPIIVANMTSVATTEMAKVLAPKIIVPIHRNQSISERTDAAAAIAQCKNDAIIAITVGLHEDTSDIIKATKCCDIMFLELNHADMKQVLETTQMLSKHITTVVGNIATAEATVRLVEAGASMIKVGVGNGSPCTTRLVTGCGVPQLSAVMECVNAADDYGVPVIADGGIRNSGDAVKYLAAGASFVMIGSLFAGTDEADEERRYSGMASKECNPRKEGIIPEGIAVQVPYKGSAKKVHDDLIAGIRQGMAMVGARTLAELREQAVFQRVTTSTINENVPHIMGRI